MQERAETERVKQYAHARLAELEKVANEKVQNSEKQAEQRGREGLANLVLDVGAPRAAGTYEKAKKAGELSDRAQARSGRAAARPLDLVRTCSRGPYSGFIVLVKISEKHSIHIQIPESHPPVANEMEKVLDCAK